MDVYPLGSKAPCTPLRLGEWFGHFREAEYLATSGLLRVQRSSIHGGEKEGSLHCKLCHVLVYERLQAWPGFILLLKQPSDL